MHIRHIPRWALVPILLFPAFGAGLAVSAAASGSSSTTFYACLHNGTLSKVSTSAHTCPTGYKKVNWNAVGPQGIQGIPGSRGPMGTAGTPGANGKDGSPVTCILVTLCTWGYNYSGGSYGFNFSRDVAFDGAHLWVINTGGNSVTELNASDGSLVQTLSGGSYGFSQPEGIAFDGAHLWVANDIANSVTEFNASDGRWVRTLSGGSYGFNEPYGIAFDGAHLWVANASSTSVTEIFSAG